MIKYQDGELLDLLPAPMAEDVDIIALSYSIKMGIAKFIVYVAKTTMYADVDNQPESILDYMAIELDAAYYEQSMDIETKRELIKGALKWCMTAGTKKAVEELVRTVFGKGDVTEWYEFENGPGEPGTFNVETGSQLTEENYERFSRIVKATKPSSAHINGMASSKDVETGLYIGSTLAKRIDSTLNENRTETEGFYINPKTLIAAIGEIYEDCIANTARTITSEIKTALYTGTVLSTTLRADLYEDYSANTDVNAAVYAGGRLRAQ
jgi:phage tail P2-like protein